MPFTTDTARISGRKGGIACRDEYGPEHFRESGRKGGLATAARHGSAHYSAIGRLGGRRTQELIARGKQLEAAE